jgi:hypothetical protein
VLIIPIADGAEMSPASFEITSDLPKKSATLLKFSDVHKLRNGVVWLKYKVISS